MHTYPHISGSIPPGAYAGEAVEHRLTRDPTAQERLIKISYF